YARVELLSWDLINEPSFGDPKKIFAPRPLPLYDRFEVAAFQQWLAKRYTLNELQLRWRQTPADLPDWAHVLPPREEDYTTYVRETEIRAFLQVADYTRFSQDTFNQWAARMREAIRASGSQTLVGVGQDESGARISPQFYASALDYTTTHPWWNIDDLLWDMLLDKTPGKPNLIQETGVMLARDIDGRPWRSEQDSAYLLERKLITGLIARGAGVIQWLWHINGYMTSDNENSIGLVRPDGSVKPELAIVEEFGRLMFALEGQVLETPPPDVWVVIPYSQWFVRPDLARYGTRRAIRLLGNHLGIIPQMVSEYHLEALITTSPPPRTVIVPALQLFDPQAWSALLHYVYDGGTLMVSGVLSRDSHNLSFDLNVDGMPETFSPVAVSHYEELIDNAGQVYPITFTGEKISYVKKAHNHLYRYHHGKGLLLWCGLPLELSSEVSAIIEIYQQAINHTGEKHHSGTTPTREASTPDVGEERVETSLAGASLLIARQPLRDGALLLAVSESSSTQRIALDEGIQITVDPNRAGALILRKDQAIQTFGGLHCVRAEGAA
ncbi:MAG TPA: beta-galactosidase, partial [Ktedonobacteraceae bacterium]